MQGDLRGCQESDQRIKVRKTIQKFCLTCNISRESVNEMSDTDDEPREEQEGYDASTLPYR